MADAKSEQLWAHTSSLIASIFNAQCTEEKNLVQPDRFNPHRVRQAKKKRQEERVGVGFLKGFLGL